MRFRSGRRTAAGSSRSENLLDQQVNKEQRGDVVAKTENQLVDQDPSLPLLKRSISPSSDKSDLDYSKRTSSSLFQREANDCSKLENAMDRAHSKHDDLRAEVKMEPPEEDNFRVPMEDDSAGHSSRLNDNESNGQSSMDNQLCHPPLEGPFVDTNDINNMETQEPDYPLDEDGRREITETRNDSDKENNDEVDSPQRKRSRKRSLSQKDNNGIVGSQTSRSKRRISLDASDAEFSTADESVERKKRGRSAKASDAGNKTSKKIKGENGSLDSASKNQCLMMEPSVKVTKEESRADLEAKTNVREGRNRTEEEGPDLGEEDTEVLEGTLVVWEGPPHEPLFKKKAAKPGRFYIVNCGEAKGSSLNSANSLPSTVANPKPAEAPANTSATCSCCASGCHGVITGETSKRVSRRRPKGPKKVQLVTKEEHHKILNSYIEDKKYEPDFKVDSLFANQVDQNQQNPNGSGEGGNRRTRLQNKMGGKQGGKGKQNQADQSLEAEQVVSFTVKGNPELVDDVAGYESVDCNNALLQKNGEQNPEFGIQIGQDEFIGLDQMRQKRPYRMRKLPTKEIQGEITCDPSGKPRCTYTDLIEKALLQSNGGLTVSEIYNWISTNYPYFQANDDRWKNSVRHNLSINPYFKKGDKARNGAGHLWVISEDGKGIRPPIRRKNGADNILDAICIENGEIIPIRNETDRAISVILSEYAMASMQHQNNHQEEESPVTYIQIPNDIAIGGGNDGNGQVICYEDLPDGSYAIGVQEPNGHEDQMYTISDFGDGNVIIVNPDESNKENMNGHQMMDDMVVSDFSVLANDGGMITSGRMSAPPVGSSSAYGGGNCSRRDRPLNRSSSLPTASSLGPQEIIMEDSATGVTVEGESTQELTMLNTVSVGDHQTMDAIGIVPGSQDATQVIEIMGDHLFDAKELGMVYEYDNQGDPLFL